MRRPALTNSVRVIAVIFIVLMLVQGLPLLGALNASPRAVTTGAAVSNYYPPATAQKSFSFATFWDTIQPIITILIVLFLGRIWFLLEKISDRLARNNRMDVALTLKKDY